MTSCDEFVGLKNISLIFCQYHLIAYFRNFFIKHLHSN